MKRLDVIEHLTRSAESGVYNGPRGHGLLVKRLRACLNGEFDKMGNMAQVMGTPVAGEPIHEPSDQPFYRSRIQIPDDAVDEPDTLASLGMSESDFR